MVKLLIPVEGALEEGGSQRVQISCLMRRYKDGLILDADKKTCITMRVQILS